MNHNVNMPGVILPTQKETSEPKAMVPPNTVRIIAPRQRKKPKRKVTSRVSLKSSVLPASAKQTKGEKKKKGGKGKQTKPNMKNHPYSVGKKDLGIVNHYKLATKLRLSLLNTRLKKLTDFIAKFIQK